MSKPAIRLSEADEQAALFLWAEWAKGQHPELALLFHIPNGGKRDKVTAARLKEQGVKAGVPDLFLPVARGGWYGLWIELKVKGNRQSPAQCKWQVYLEKNRYRVEVCYGWEAAMGILLEYLREYPTIPDIGQIRRRQG